jgi:hypothetical protein
VKVLAKSTKRRVKLSRRPASGTTNSESDCEYLAVKMTDKSACTMIIYLQNSSSTLAKNTIIRFI